MDDLKLEICAPPVANQQIDLCVNDPIFNLFDSLITPNGQNGIWSGPSPLSNGYLGTFDPSSDTSGMYTYTIADTVPNCPDSIGNFTITVGLGPQVFLGNDTVLCTSETLTLDATSDGATYLWQDNSTNPIFVISQPGTYWVQVTDSCVVTSDTIVIQYAPYPIVNIGNDTVLCAGEVLVLEATTPNGDYLWNTNDTVSQLTVGSAGIYWVDVTVNYCTTRDSIAVGFDPMPVVNLGQDSVMCQGQSVVLQANNPNATYLWHNGSTNPIFFVNSSGTYWVQVSINNCVASDTVEYTFIPLPTPNLGKDTSLCTGQTLLLNAYFPGASYLWQDSSTDSTYLVTTAGKYWVAVTNICSTLVDTINVTYNPYPTVDLGADFELCEGETVRLDVKKTGASYKWQDQSNQSYYDVKETGLYSVTVTVKGCSTEDSVNARMIPSPVPNLGNDTVICSNSPLILDVTADNATYIWQDNSTQALYQIVDPGIYWVEISVSGCLGSDTLFVDEISCEVVLEMPNIITPNGDGQNELFLPMVIEGVKSLHTEIYNRWGEKIYETNDGMVMWPGTTNQGSEVPDGVYFYTIKITGEDGSTSEISGSVTVSR
jgi:gliding motility-associated-like protein